MSLSLTRRYELRKARTHVNGSGFVASGACRVGCRHIHTATQPQHKAGTTRQADEITHAAQALLTAIITKANCLARSGMARVARQSRTMGPQRGWCSTQCSQRALPREKHQAASSTNGVVGSKGRKMPNTPRAKATVPASNHSGRNQRVREVMVGLIGGLSGGAMAAIVGCCRLTHLKLGLRTRPARGAAAAESR